MGTSTRSLVGKTDAHDTAAGPNLNEKEGDRHGPLAERAGFEPAVRLINARRSIIPTTRMLVGPSPRDAGHRHTVLERCLSKLARRAESLRSPAASKGRPGTQSCKDLRWKTR